jgi:uncharacterized protein (DUF1501 family)
MNRRDFIKASGIGTAAFAINGLPINAFADATGRMHKLRGHSDKIFVFVLLNGGCDGLNTVLNLDRYTELTNARANVLIPQNQALGLNGAGNTALHPAMTKIRDMYNNGLINIVQGVGYPNFNYSHFRATDIYNSASDANTYIDTGWIGRYLSTVFPGAPYDYPNADFLDPLAVQIGSNITTALSAPGGQIGFALSDINSFYQIANGAVDPAPNTPAGHELTYIRYISLQTQSYTQSVQNAATLGTNNVTYPANNKLAEKFKIVAKLISGGLKTPFYVVDLNGFDTHSDQVDMANHATGNHADLLAELSDAIEIFYQDLKIQGKEDKVAGCTITEFGRRIKSNASKGTDHGSGTPMIVFGKNVISGINGSSPVLPTNATVNDQVPMQFDFRQIYSSILQDWFELDKTKTDTILGASFTTLPIFKKAPTDIGTIDNIVKTFGNLNIVPNPVADHASINFTSAGGAAQIKLYTEVGQLVNIIYQNEIQAGPQSINFERGNLRSGTYYIQIHVGNANITGKLIVA